jgi:hypothetical protein
MRKLELFQGPGSSAKTRDVILAPLQYRPFYSPPLYIRCSTRDCQKEIISQPQKTQLQTLIHHGSPSRRVNGLLSDASEKGAL